MSVRRRRIKERVERNRRWLEGHEALTLSLHGIQQAITAARARGETEVTDRFLQEAFLATRAPASSEETRTALAKEYADDGSRGEYPWFKCPHGVAKPNHCFHCENDRQRVGAGP